MNLSELDIGIPRGVMIGSILAIVLVAIAHGGLKWWSRRRYQKALEVQPESADRGARYWLSMAIQDLTAPVALMMWINGLHYALTSLIAELSHPGFVQQSISLLDGLRGVGSLLSLMWILARLGRAVERWLTRLFAGTRSKLDDLILPIAGIATRLLLPLLALMLGSQMLAVPEGMQTMFRNGVSLVLIGAFAYVLCRLVDAVCQLVLLRYRIDISDNREARGVYTQVTVLRKVAMFVIGVIALACMLMVFDSVRQVGAAIIASAGVAGIVVGFAAQRSLGALVAGFQIALTQPIRMDDVVIVEGEWGRIEEITLTYVVVHIWDERRLIVPITYFLEKPFQNWTRTSAELLATVFLYVDYSVKVEAIREKLTSILEESELWDRKVNVLQVTDATEQTVQVRALASASDASRAWDLRCEIREHLIRFLQQEQPGSLPRLRLDQSCIATAQTVS
jgi:small-conductance mechanosensitive channel